MSKSISCIVVDDEPVAREILENYIAQTASLDLIQACKNVEEAIQLCSNNKVDLIFLDIEMPRITGLSFAKIIDKKIKIIFTTAHREYAIDGFNLDAIDYLLKPFSFERFQQALHKYQGVGRLSSTRSNQLTTPPTASSEFIFIRSERKMLKVNFNEIVLIESMGDYLEIHLADHALKTRETIANLEAKLPQTDFLRIHRSFIVALQKITAYTNEHIEIESKKLPISRSYKDFVLKRLNEFKVK